MKSVPRWVKVLIIIGVSLVLVWFAIRTIFPLPVKNAIEIMESKFVIDVVDISLDADGFTYLEHLKNGNWVYRLSIDSKHGNKHDAYRLYILSEDFSVINTLDCDYDVNGMYALNNGNFAVDKMTKDENGTVSHSLLEYNTEFEVVTERLLPDTMTFYSDGFYYSRVVGGGLQIFDENLTFVNEYKLEEFPGAKIIFFTQSYDGEVFIIACYDENNFKYGNHNAYLLRPLDGGEDVKYSLAFDARGDYRGNRPGDERYDFYTLSSNFNDVLLLLFQKNIRGDYLYGINKDGSFEKIGNYVSPYADSTFNYYQGIPYDGKRYYTKAVRDGKTETVTLYLYEYTGTYPN
ncbi:MAG: hypothetical protein LBL80_03995 [Ruminococcus sp.]|jgi:hypothetical protein|nr:hypothetical protein [Ruminococcus sp.]